MHWPRQVALAYCIVGGMVVLVMRIAALRVKLRRAIGRRCVAWITMMLNKSCCCSVNGHTICCLSVSLSVCLSVCLCVYLSVYLICLSVCCAHMRLHMLHIWKGALHCRRNSRFAF